MSCEDDKGCKNKATYLIDYDTKSVCGKHSGKDFCKKIIFHNTKRKIIKKKIEKYIKMEMTHNIKNNKIGNVKLSLMSRIRPRISKGYMCIFIENGTVPDRVTNYPKLSLDNILPKENLTENALEKHKLYVIKTKNNLQLKSLKNYIINGFNIQIGGYNLDLICPLGEPTKTEILKLYNDENYITSEIIIYCILKNYCFD